MDHIIAAHCQSYHWANVAIIDSCMSLLHQTHLNYYYYKTAYCTYV